jgi:tetratricopeptide (TPR) repeat protein
VLSFAAALLVCALGCAPPRAARAQDKATYDADRKRAFQLYEANNFVAALPLLEKLAAANPEDVPVLERLGFALYANSTIIEDPAARKQARQRARGALLRARELGDDSNLLQYALGALEAPDDAAPVPFSDLQGAEQAMRAGEQFFAAGQLAKAIEAYQRALQLDPHLYYAALFIGDSYFKQNLHDKAGEWFARAVQIDPDIETAHRYWGDALVAQDKRDAARDKFVEAIVAEPYTQSARVGLAQWGQRYKRDLHHPRLDIPVDVQQGPDGKNTINLSAQALIGGEDGGSAWLVYGITRTAWSKEKFAKAYPNERAYRHSLAEEVEALNAVADLVRAQMKEKKIKQLNPSLANLLKLSDAGLLEAYVLFARADQGIAQDYVAYRRANRDKLRRYWVEFVTDPK